MESLVKFVTLSLILYSFLKGKLCMGLLALNSSLCDETKYAQELERYFFLNCSTSPITVRNGFEAI